MFGWTIPLTGDVLAENYQYICLVLYFMFLLYSVWINMEKPIQDWNNMI